MNIDEVLQRIDWYIEVYGEERWGGGPDAAYGEGAYNVLCKVRDEIKEKLNNGKKMKFEDVLPLLREGKKARCPSWNDGEYIFIYDNYKGFRYVSNDGEEEFTNLCNFDIIDSDWEIVD